MREILFRGKLSNGEWAYGNLNISVKGTTIITPDETLLGKYGQVNPETVGQFTGLTDKNGTKIFEGDILKVIYCEGTDWEESYKTKVTYNNGAFVVDMRGCDYDCTAIGWAIDEWSENDTECEVIGNIHDNPELLGGV